MVMAIMKIKTGKMNIHYEYLIGKQITSEGGRVVAYSDLVRQFQSTCLMNDKFLSCFSGASMIPSLSPNCTMPPGEKLVCYKRFIKKY